ncbi:hypothetical protein MKW98_002907 [Papaver atlanticum]|uniref:Cyclic nucleotide-binding domain-containing protein n=1 Tax=Papaver atlanticum TaxID=357466 RepID=A0AAD4TCR0_9MAGN|nr:hypothetical protein MKW98_002907 [Papaver atlanticum]
MSVVLDGPISLAVRKVEEVSEATSAIVFFGLCMVLGISTRHLLRGTKVPYTVALLVIGIGLGSLEFGTNLRLGKLGAGIRLWASINPDLLLAVFLPALLFEGAFLMEVHQIKKCIGQMLLLAGPGVLISTFCLGSALKLVFPYNWSWKTSLLLAGLLSATDPVAVVALLKELGASKELTTIIDGESMMNDGVAVVVYQFFFRMVLGESFSFGDIITYLTQVSVGALGIGPSFGVVSVFWLGFIFNDTVIEISLTLAVSYLAYFTLKMVLVYLAYFTAQDGAGVSGILAVMTLGMFYSAFTRAGFKGDNQQSLHHFWEMVSYIGNTLIFILSGVIISESVIHSGNDFIKHETSWGYLVLLYVLVQVSRAIVVGTLYPFLHNFGYGLDWKEAIVLVWSGLRGRASDTSAFLNRETGAMFLFFTSGIVFLTIIVNGSTTSFVLHFLGMNKLSTTKRRILEHTRHEMMNKALEAFGGLEDDEELGPAEWHTVRKYLSCLNNNLEEDHMHPHSVSKNESNIDAKNLKDTRVRLLIGVQAAYWGMLNDGRISQNTATTLFSLLGSVDEAIDLVSHDSLCDWKGIISHVHFPSHYRLLQMSVCPQKLATYLTVERLEFACYVCAAFLLAHRIARRQLHDFMGDSEIVSLVINESESEGDEARFFLEEVRATFPQVLHVVKLRQATYAVLKHLSEYVENLKKVGILEDKEVIHLHESVQTDLERVFKNPPLAKMPKIDDMLRAHPLLSALPSIARLHLQDSTRELTKLRGVAICREGTILNGIWLVSNGVVKWESKNMRNKGSLHPTFSHGSSLGLYEVLSGNPYIYDLITDTVIYCFFVESERIPSLLKADPAVEDILWQESVVVIAKLLLPQIFEKMVMQDLRSLVMERSHIWRFKKIPPHCIGFLLEGTVATITDQEEMITSPGVLSPIYGDLSFLSLETSGSKAANIYRRGTSYQIATRARVIIFDMATVEADLQLQRRTSSWIYAAEESPKCLSREHNCLKSWPELLHVHTQGAHGSVGSSYEKPTGSQRKELHGHSYTRVPSTEQVQPLENS